MFRWLAIFGMAMVVCFVGYNAYQNAEASASANQTQVSMVNYVHSTPTAEPISASSLICGAGNSATVNNKLVKLTSVSVTDLSIEFEINGILQDSMTNNDGKWLGGIFIQNVKGCIIASN